MSRLASYLRLYPPGTIVTKAMMQDHREMQRLLDAEHARDLEAKALEEEDEHILQQAEYYRPYD